eukprot:CAMPEP_0171315468 /NCGR_PEP_ID=MMETSP0816-20121228/64370_1 /TAXON_ID=420281 /ORGANISM="Proboscia inermis, Strain CCAP1064/1" /LENGTH=30 /DNA_ID= /DNA_START= /DNA_END= /DNA_ORIENTATION=
MVEVNDDEAITDLVDFDLTHQEFLELLAVP